MSSSDTLFAAFGEPTRYVFDESNAPLIPARCLDVGDVIVIDGATRKITSVSRIRTIGDIEDQYTLDDKSVVSLRRSKLVRVILAQGEQSCQCIRSIRADQDALYVMHQATVDSQGKSYSTTR